MCHSAWFIFKNYAEDYETNANSQLIDDDDVTKQINIAVQRVWRIMDWWSNEHYDKIFRNNQIKSSEQIDSIGGENPAINRGQTAINQGIDNTQLTANLVSQKK